MTLQSVSGMLQLGAHPRDVLARAVTGRAAGVAEIACWLFGKSGCTDDISPAEHAANPLPGSANHKGSTTDGPS